MKETVTSCLKGCMGGGFSRLSQLIWKWLPVIEVGLEGSLQWLGFAKDGSAFGHLVEPNLIKPFKGGVNNTVHSSSILP
jgi:hypothetical protein